MCTTWYKAWDSFQKFSEVFPNFYLFYTATNILEGEASESDDEEISHNTFVVKANPKSSNEFSKVRTISTDLLL